MNELGYDEFGNPRGKAFDLGGVDDERLRGERILLYVCYTPGTFMRVAGERFEWHLAQQAVAERNIQMDVVLRTDPKHKLDDAGLSAYTQLWFVSDMQRHLTDQQVESVCRFVDCGNGLLIWADNEPYYADANVLAGRLVGTHFSGNKYGDKILKPGEALTRGHFVEHPLTHGVNNLYEGITICTVAPAEGVTLLAQSHDGQYCMACYEQGKRRIVLDTGFTKLIQGKFHKTAGTARYFRNVAFWLSRSTRDSQYLLFTPGRESMASIGPGALSQTYAYDVVQPVTLVYVLYWEDHATLGLTIEDPTGKALHDTASSRSPLQLEIPMAVPGKWLCQVKGVDVPRPAFPYVLTLVTRGATSTSQKGFVANARAPSAISPSAVRAVEPDIAAPPKSRRLPIYLLADTSDRAQPMLGPAGEGLRALVERLKARQGHRARASLALIVAGAMGRVAMPLADASRFIVPSLVGRGQLELAGALDALLGSLEKDKQPGDLRPLVLILLRGKPVEGWSAAAERLRKISADRSANVFVVGAEGFSDMAMLARLSTLPPLRMPVVSREAILELFDWVRATAETVLNQAEIDSSARNVSPPSLPSCVAPMT